MIFQSDKGIGLDNTDFSQLGAMAGMYQQPGSPSSPVVSRFTPSNQSYLTWGHLFLAIISNGRLSQSETQSATLPHIRGPTFGPLQPRGAYLAAKRLPFAQYAIPATLWAVNCGEFGSVLRLSLPANFLERVYEKFGRRTFAV